MEADSHIVSVASWRDCGAILRNSDYRKKSGIGAGRQDNEFTPSGAVALALEEGRESQGSESAGFSRICWKLVEAE